MTINKIARIHGYHKLEQFQDYEKSFFKIVELL